MCPKGDDPLTLSQNYRTIRMSTNATSGDLNGTFTLRFHGETFSFSANASQYTAADCKTSFESLNNIESVSCTRGEVSTTFGAEYTVEILAWPSYPYQNNVFNHEGNPPISHFSCDTSDVTGAVNVSCSIEDVVSANIRGKPP